MFIQPRRTNLLSAVAALAVATLAVATLARAWQVASSQSMLPRAVVLHRLATVATRSLHRLATVATGSVVASAMLLVVIAGCGRDHDGVAVTGNVTVDGQALPQGSIVFRPATKESGPQTAAPIVDGAYTLSPDIGPGVGDYRVMIYADQPLEFSPDEPKEFFARADKQLPVNTIPAEYNTRSTLQVTTATGENHFDFAISTTPEK